MRARGNTFQKPGFKDDRDPRERQHEHTSPSTHQGSGNTDKAETQAKQNPVVRAISVTGKLASGIKKSSSFLLVSDLGSSGSSNNKNGSKHSTPVTSSNNS